MEDGEGGNATKAGSTWQEEEDGKEDRKTERRKMEDGNVGIRRCVNDVCACRMDGESRWTEGHGKHGKHGKRK